MIRHVVDMIGLVLSVLSAPFLWRGSLGVPWDIQTIDGTSERERAFKRRTRISADIGFVLLGAGFTHNSYLDSFGGNQHGNDLQTAYDRAMAQL